MDIKIYTQYLVHILKSAIEQVTPNPIPENIDEGFLLRFAEFHKLLNIVYLTIGDRLSPESQKQLSELYNRSVYKSAAQQYYLEEVENALRDNKICYLVLKGKNLAELYPSEDMRQTADFDIYLGRENSKKAKEIMVALGFDIMSYTDTDEHDEYIIDKVAMCETHPVLIQNKHPWQEECNKITDRLLSTEKPYELKMSNEDFYLYNLAHTAKHMKVAGIGIRAFLDMWLIDRKYSSVIDRDVLDEKLKKANLYEFDKNARNLWEYWFCSKVPDDLTLAMAEYVAESGWVGTLNQMQSTDLAEAAGNANSVKTAKLKKYASMFFISYEDMADKYSVLKKHKWLLPFCYIYRFFNIILKKRDIMARVSDGLESGDMQTGKAIVDLKKRIGL